MINDVALSARQVRKSFGVTEVIRGIDLDVWRGEKHALIGPNGAGKSTMFNLLSGAFPPTEGEIRIGEHLISGLNAAAINRLGLARSFQITSVFPRLSVFENIQIGAFSRFGIRFDAIHRANRCRQVNEEVDRLMELVRLTRVQSTLAGNLSYSDQRALELGLTLATDPSIILLDEPTAGMSRDEAEYAISLIRSVTAGRTLVIVEHDMDAVFSLANRISVLVYGEVIATGSPDEVRANSAVQEAYLGRDSATC